MNIYELENGKRIDIGRAYLGVPLPNLDSIPDYGGKKVTIRIGKEVIGQDELVGPALLLVDIMGGNKPTVIKLDKNISASEKNLATIVFQILDKECPGGL
jgi:hypothetical protein